MALDEPMLHHPADRHIWLRCHLAMRTHDKNPGGIGGSPEGPLPPVTPKPNSAA